MYSQSRVPQISSLEELRKYVEEEFRRVQQAQSETTALELRPIHAAPVKPRDGMIVYADGTDWNPGAGVGVYTRVSGAWTKL